jgi:hypothetical protein
MVAKVRAALGKMRASKKKPAAALEAAEPEDAATEEA